MRERALGAIAWLWTLGIAALYLESYPLRLDYWARLAEGWTGPWRFPAAALGALAAPPAGRDGSVFGQGSCGAAGAFFSSSAGAGAGCSAPAAACAAWDSACAMIRLCRVWVNSS